MPAAGRPASGYSGAARPPGGAAYRIGGGGGTALGRGAPPRLGPLPGRQPMPPRNPYQMQPGMAYPGGSADFDESTGQYRSGRQPGGPGYGVQPWGGGGMPARPPGFFGGGPQGLAQRAQYQAMRGAGGPGRDLGLQQLMQQQMRQRAMRQMQQQAMARMMMGGGFTY